MIRVHSGLDHGSEVAWALWTCVRLGISISDPAAQALGGNRDGVVRVLALLARDKQVLRQAGPFAQWEAELSPDSLYDENWLYAYEAAVQGWLSSKGSVVTNDPNFNLLKSGGVSFLDLTLLGPDEDEQDDELSFDPYGGEEDTDDDDDDEEPEGEFRPSVADSYPR